jgi:outer membrane lipase/esterase
MQLIAPAGPAAGEGAIYGNLQFGQQDFEATANTSAMENDLFTATFGADIRSSEAFSFGAAVSFGGSDADTFGATIENKEVLLSAYGAAHFGLGYVDAIITGGSANLDIERSIELGATTRVEVGNTSATHTGAELGAGMVFGGDTLRHGPFLSYTWQKVNVDGYSEDGLTGTAMVFSDFTRKSTIGRIGYQVAGNAGNLHPYGRVAFAQDSQERQTRVQAGSNTMNGHFTLDGFPGARDWIEADVGLAYSVSDTTSVSASYRGRLNDDSQDLSSFNIGFQMNF